LVDLVNKLRRIYSTCRIGRRGDLVELLRARVNRAANEQG
jgi:hypothetical protein